MKIGDRCPVCVRELYDGPPPGKNSEIGDICRRQGPGADYPSDLHEAACYKRGYVRLHLAQQLSDATKWAPKPTRAVVSEWQTFADDCRAEAARCDALPDRCELAQDWDETLLGMADTAEEMRHVTDKMRSALSRISGGIDRWER